MNISETQPIERETVLYRCACGTEVRVDKELGGVCDHCERTISAKVINNVLAATMTIAGSFDELDTTRVNVDDDEDHYQLVGRTYGHFELVKPLGRGGAGYVFQALDKSLQRYVAVKVLKGSSQTARTLDDESNVDLLLQEAVAQARVAHPNIVTIYYVGKQNDEPFLAMELVDGFSLSERIARGGISFDEISNVAEQITQALTFSFGMDIIHGDIKPSNILLPNTGGAKLSDFGLARRASKKDQLAKGGTPNYLAPELLLGGIPSKQSDMYALGVTLFEMTFERLPIPLSGTTVAQWQDEHKQQEIEFPAVWPENLPPTWQSFLSKLLAKDPKDRYGTYAELSAELSKLSPTSNVIARPLPRIIAAIIDIAIVLLLTAPLRLLAIASFAEAHPAWRLLLTFVDIVPIVAYTALIFLWKQSLGRQAMHLRVINRFGIKPKGRKMAMRSVLRMAIPWLQIILFFVTFAAGSWWWYVPAGIGIGILLFVLVDTITMFFSHKRKSIHDMIFDTTVVIDS